MALLGQAVLCVWNDVDPSIEADYNDWYRLEHIPERLSVPGMLRARRYQATEGSPRYMALYEATSIDVLTSGAYRAQLANPTAWTSRVMPGFRLMQRGICDVVASAGSGPGQLAGVLHFEPDAHAEGAVRSWAQRVVPTLAALPGVSLASVWRVTPAEPASPTTALTQGTAEERPVHWVLMLEADEAPALEAAKTTVLAEQPFAHDVVTTAFYPTVRLLGMTMPPV